MAENEELNSLERVRERLYSTQAPATFEEPQLSERPVERARGWEKLKTVQDQVRHEAEFISGPARFFIVALLFFVVTAGGALFYLVYGGRSVSSNNVNLAIQGPTTIASGDTVPLLITVENRNPVAIRHVVLTIDMPEGTKSPDDPTQDLPYVREELGDIESGGKVERAVRATVFGSENQRVALPIKIEYRADTSEATFIKNKEYDFTVSTSPITLSVTALSQVSAGQPVTVDVSVKSNATTMLENVAVVAEYPFGFALSSATPQPAGTTGTLFNLGSFTPGEEKRITLKGTLSGENNDDRIFKFNAGTLASSDASTLSTTFTTKDVNIKLTKPFLATTLSINRDTSDNPVIDPGVPVQAVVTWTNTLATPIRNATVSVAFSGGGLDPASVSTNGFYRSSDTTVLFDANTNAALANLQPGDSGQGNITFRAKSASALAGLRNPSILVRVSVAGQRMSEVNVPETISSSLARTIKVGTNLAMTSRVLRTTGPFANTGPLPPTPNQESTYTIVYSLTDSGNAVAGTRVTAALPTYVRFTGATSPADGSITYNEATRTVTWEAGDVASGAAKSAAFQVAITPSTSQIGTSPVLVTSQQVTAVDRFTSKQITGSVPALTTRTPTDPGASAFGTVQ
jgi:hypothetical protein